MTVSPTNQRINITWRAVIIGLLLIPLNAVWIMQMEAVYYSAHSTLIALFFNVVCNLLVLILLNIPLRKLSPNWAFNQAELLTIYVMLSMSSALVGHSMLQILPATMAAPLALATPENDWHDLFWRYIPQWLAISDERALEGYVRGVKKGEPTLYLAPQYPGMARAGNRMVGVRRRANVRHALYQHHHPQAVDRQRKTDIPDRPTAI